MRDVAKKITKIQRDTDKSRWALHLVWFEDLGEQKTVVHTKELELMEFEDKLLREGISPLIIEKHRELVKAQVWDEEIRDGECY